MKMESLRSFCPNNEKNLAFAGFFAYNKSRNGGDQHEIGR